VLRFLAQASYEHAAKMRVSPAPDIVTRVFMVHRGVAPGDFGGFWSQAAARATFWANVVGIDSARASDPPFVPGFGMGWYGSQAMGFFLALSAFVGHARITQGATGVVTKGPPNSGACLQRQQIGPNPPILSHKLPCLGFSLPLHHEI
jgi:hypothetical protein